MTNTREQRTTWLIAGAIVALGLPTLLLRYLPMTDFPGHLAVVSIIKNFHDPAFGFDRYYELDFSKTLYWLPYGLTLGLARVLPIELALRVLVFLSVVVYPLGVLALLRTLRRPVVLALLAFPLVYNRAFFWGFINFNLAIGLASLCIALLCVPTPSRTQRVLLGALGIATALTHTHGIALLGAFCVLWLALQRQRAVLMRMLPLVPAGLLSVGWIWLARQAPGYGKTIWAPFFERLLSFPAQTLGGYQDPIEPVLLLIAVLAAVVLRATSRHSASEPATPRPAVDRVLWLLAGLNVLLYFVLPVHTMTAKYIHFRHAFLALCLLPVALGARVAIPVPKLPQTLLVVLGLASTLSAWGHLVAFNAEAHDFDAVLQAAPRRARIASVIFEPYGPISRTRPYMHFAGYIQAHKGGFISHGFAKFWNVPVRYRRDAGIPLFEWKAEDFDDRESGGFYDHVLLRAMEKATMRQSPAFPFEPVLFEPPWQLYRRAPSAP